MAQRSVFIVGSDERIIAPVAESLHRLGLRCVVVVPPEQSFSISSADVSLAIPLQGSITDAATMLCLLAEAERAEWITAASDSGLAIIAAGLDRLLQICPVACPPAKTVAQALDSDAIAASLQPAGLTTIIRPEPDAQPVDTASAVCLSLLVSQGVTQAVFQYGVTRVNDNRSRDVAESQSAERWLIARCEAILGAIGWDGIAMLEFRPHERRNELSFHRFIGRFWDSVSLAISCGVDFPRYAWETSIGNRPLVPTGYRIGVKAAIAHPAVDTGEPHLSSSSDQPWHHAPEFQELSAQDDRTLPSFGAFEVARRLPLRAAQIYLWRQTARRIGLQRSQKVARRTQSVLFVCKGNIIRSAAAAQFLRDMLRDMGITDVSVESAGTHARSGSAPDPRAEIAARQFGSSLQNHLAQPVSDAIVESADVILSMDDLNYVDLYQRFPSARSRLAQLGGMTHEGKWKPVEITDPYSGSQADVTRAIAQIHEAVTALASALRDSTSRV